MLGKKIDKIYGIDYNSYLCAGIGNPIKLQLGEIHYYLLLNQKCLKH